MIRKISTLPPGATALKLKLCLLLVILALPALLSCGPPDLATMVERVKGGVVRIDTAEGNGSGVIFDTDDDDGALVLTNYHVVAEGGRIAVMVDDADRYRGRLQGFDAELDLAVLRICCGDFQTLPFGEVAEIRPGSEVIVMGYPLGLPGAATVTRGIVSAIRPVRNFEIIQVDAPLNPGNSGGPLLSAAGEVLGINTFGISDTEGLGFALSERMVQAALPNLQRERGFVRAPTATPTRIPAWPKATPTRRPTNRNALAIPTAVPTPVEATQIPTLLPTPIPIPKPTATPLPPPTPTLTPLPLPTPTRTPTPVKLTAISIGGGICGLEPDGTPICWGPDGGTGITNPPEGEKFKAISVGQVVACGLRFDGTVACWGWTDKVVHRPLEEDLKERPWATDAEFVAIASGSAGVCALNSDGTPICRGSFDSWVSHNILSRWNVKLSAITIGRANRWTMCVLDVNGVVSCHCDFGCPDPPADKKFMAISVTGCGLLLDGDLFCWGSHGEDRDRGGRYWYNDDPPPEGSKFIAISGNCGLLPDSTPYCWGGIENPYRGQKFTAISYGVYIPFSLGLYCGLRPDGILSCWSANPESPTELRSYPYKRVPVPSSPVR